MELAGKDVNQGIFRGGLPVLCKESTNVLNCWYVFLARESGEVRQPVPIWQRYMIERLGIRMSIHVRLVFRFQPEAILNHISYPVCPVFVLQIWMLNPCVEIWIGA
jgi:hypothetical protein